MNSDNLVGITLGNRYDMLEKIGTGGMATVYKAKDTLLNRYVAIKILRDSLEGEEQVVSNFIKEAQSSASLVHNNIVSVYDVGEEGGLNYMVMEYVDGITLKEYIKQKGVLPWQEACDFAIQIGQGISEAHSINIIHRDLSLIHIFRMEERGDSEEKIEERIKNDKEAFANAKNQHWDCIIQNTRHSDLRAFAMDLDDIIKEYELMEE